MINVLTLYWSARVCRSCRDGDERYQLTCITLCADSRRATKRATVIVQLSAAITSTLSIIVARPKSTMILPANQGNPKTPIKYARLNSNNAWEVVPLGASLATRPLITEYVRPYPIPSVAAAST